MTNNKKLKHTSGKDLFDKCLKLIREEKMDYKQFGSLCKRWLELNEFIKIPDCGWLKKDDLETAGVTQVNGEWKVDNEKFFNYNNRQIEQTFEQTDLYKQIKEDFKLEDV